jgi:hypothetical protein
MGSSVSRKWAFVALDKYRSLACLVISLSLITWITAASDSFNIRAIGFLLFLPYLLLAYGRLITTSLMLPSSFILDFILGVVAISIAVVIWKIFVPFSLWILLLVLLVSLVGTSKLLPQTPPEPMSGIEFLAVIVSLVAATGWSQDLLAPIKANDGQFLFKPWSDFFFHATIVARSLGEQTLAQAGNYEWQGLPAIVYHYASYSLTILLVKVASVRAYIAVVAFWTPFGCFLSGLAAYALGSVFWNPKAGLAALAAVMMIPDAALLDFGHPYYGYHWLQEVDPGGLYGVAIAGTALVMVAQGWRARRGTWITSGVVLSAFVALFKVHIFVASFPLIFSFATLAWPSHPRGKWLVLSLCVAISVSVVQLASYFHVGPDVHFDFFGGAWFWTLLANMARKTPVELWYQVFSRSNSFPSYLPLAIGLLLINALGIFAILAPFTWMLAACWKKWTAPNTLSVAAIAILLLMTFALSRNTTLGLADELNHRPFVWAYWLVGSLSGGYLASIVGPSWFHQRRRILWAALFAFLLVPIYYGGGLQRGRWPGAQAHSSLTIDRGLIECARYIRNQPPATTIVQDSALETWFPILGALAERPSFATRPKFWMGISNTFRQSSYRLQLQKLKSLESANNLPDLQHSARETGIHWFVCHPDDHYPWPREFLDHPVFESNGYKVYDMERSFDLRG